MKKLIGIVMALAVFAAVNAADDATHGNKEVQGKEKEMNKSGHVCYNSIAFQAQALEKEGKDAEAITMLEDAKAKTEYEHHYQMLFPTLIKLYEKTGQYEKCISLWNDGHKKNMTFGLDPQKDQFKPYMKLKGFKEAVKKDQELVKAKAEPELQKEDCEDHGDKKSVIK